MVAARAVVAVAGAAYFAADSQGISSVPKLLTALRKVVPQMVAAELGVRTRPRTHTGARCDIGVRTRL